MAMSTEMKLERLSYLTQNGGTKVCKKLFQKRVAELIPHNEDPDLWTTDAFLQMNKHKIDFSNLNKRSQQILFPVEGSHTQLEQWDLTLLINILATACQLSVSLKQRLSHLKKLRNKLAHFGDSEMSDTHYDRCLEKVSVIFNAFFDELKDKELETTIRCMITKLEKSEICDKECTKAFQELCKSVKESEEKTWHIISQENQETRRKIAEESKANRELVEIGNEQLMEKLTRLENRLSMLHVSDSSDRMILPVKIKPVNCDAETDEITSRELVDIFTEAIKNNVDHTEFPEDDQEKRRKIFEVFRVLKEKGYPIVHAETGCVLLYFQFSSVSSLLSFYIDYIKGNLETYLNEMKKAVQIDSGFQDSYFEVYLYKDDLYEILQNIGEMIEKKKGASIFFAEATNNEERKKDPGTRDSQKSGGGNPSVLVTIKPSQDFDERDFENTLQWASEQLTNVYKSPLQGSIVKNEDKGSERRNAILKTLDTIQQRFRPDKNVNAEADITIGIKKCTNENAKSVSEYLAGRFNEKISGKSFTKTGQFPDNIEENLTEAVKLTEDSFSNEGRHILNVKPKCLLFRIKCDTVNSFTKLIRDCLNGDIVNQFNDILTAVRSVEGCENAEFESEIQEVNILETIYKLVMTMDTFVPNEDANNQSGLCKHESVIQQTTTSREPEVYERLANNSDQAFPFSTGKKRACGACDNVLNPADGYCNDCEEYMCRSHQKMKFGKNHVLTAYTGCGKTKIEDKCKNHTRETIKYYCRNHDRVVCGDCISSDHMTCQPEFITELVHQFEESSESGQFEKLEADIAESKLRIQSERNENQKLFHNAIREIEKFRKDINTLLDTMEEIIKAEVRNILDENEKHLSELEQAIRHVSDEIAKIKEILDTNVYRADSLFIRRVECKPKVDIVAKAMSEFKSDKGIKTYFFEPETKLKEMLTSSLKLGIIKATSMIKTENKPTTEAGLTLKNVYHLPDPRAAGFGIGKRVCLAWSKKAKGTVTAVDPSGYVHVKWDGGRFDPYKAGAGGKYHVKLL